MKIKKDRFSVAYDYWIEKGAPPSAACDLAHQQITFEDNQEYANSELYSWKGPNDIMPTVPWI